MTDTNIKGSGNSRSLKTVPNALTLYPDYISMMQAMADGSFPIDLGPLNDAGLNVRGNDLNKSTLLTDALCTALGLATTATPTEAMEKLRTLIATAQSTANSANTNANGRGKIETGSVSPSGTNLTLNFSFTPKVIVIAIDYGGERNGNGIIVRPFEHILMVTESGSRAGNITWGSRSASFSFYVGPLSTVYYAGIG